MALFSGSANIRSGSFSGNSAAVDGGALFADGFNVTMQNNSVSGNTAGNSGGGISNGTVLALGNVTVANNTAPVGAGIANDAGIVAPANSIIADNTGDDCSGAGLFNSLGHNIDGDGTCNLTAPSDQPSTDPQLAPLGDYGGPTPTHALLPGSPAIDQIAPLNCGLETDQRGVDRPQGETCDIGAYEVGNPCTLLLDLAYASGTLTLDFGLGTQTPVTWTVWLAVQAFTIPLWSVQVPVVATAVSFDVPFSPFPQIGTVAIQSTLTTPADGIRCSAFETIDTGTPEAPINAAQLRDLIRKQLPRHLGR